MSRTFLPVAFLALATPIASAQSTEPAQLTLEITAVPTSEGVIRASLCDHPEATIPGPCLTYAAEAAATAGTTAITFEAVKPGRYALQFWHDANANNRTEIPPEGYGYGNDAAWPPTFDSAAIDIAGDTKLDLTLQNVLDQFSAAPPPAIAPVSVSYAALKGSTP